MPMCMQFSNNKEFRLGVAVCTFNPTTMEVEAGRSQ